MCNHSQGFYDVRRSEDFVVLHGTFLDTVVSQQSNYPQPASEEPEQETWSMERR